MNWMLFDSRGHSGAVDCIGPRPRRDRGMEARGHTDHCHLHCIQLWFWWAAPANEARGTRGSSLPYRVSDAPPAASGVILEEGEGI
jgi:hypothetical protein